MLLPAYRRKVKHGKKVAAYVTLTDAVTGRRRDFHLGDYDSPESRERYKRLVTEWEAAGRRLAADGSAEMAVVDLAMKYQDFAEAKMVYKEQRAHKRASDMLVDLYGTMAARKFSPNELRLVRDAMINAGWSRNYINHQVRRIVRMFKWGVSHGHVPPDVYVALSTIEPERRGRSRAYETEPVLPVDDKLVDPIKPFVSDQVWALVQLQRLTGARGDELLKLRKGDIDQSGKNWKAQLKEHKTAHLRHKRMIIFGPQCQKILTPFMLRPDDAYLFSPREADKNRREELAQERARRGTPLSCGNRPGTNIVPLARRKPGDRYTPDSYRRAIERACDHAFPPPEALRRIVVPGNGRKAKKSTRWETDKEWAARLGSEQWAQVEQWRKAHRWHPHQLRHQAATKLREQFGLEAAQVWLGHSSALVTEAVYAERNEKMLDDLASKIG